MDWKFIGKTECKNKTPDQMFENTFTIDFRQSSEVKFTVYDADVQGYFNEEIGYNSLPLPNVLNYSGMETAYPLQHASRDRHMQLIEAQAAVLVLATVTKLDDTQLWTGGGQQIRLSGNPTHLPLLVKRLEELVADVNKTVEQTRMEFKTVNDTCNSLKRDLKHLEEESTRKNKMLETQVKSLIRYREEMNSRDDDMEQSLSGTKKKSVIGPSSSSNQCSSCNMRQQEVIKIRKEIDQIRNSHVCALCANELRKQYKQTEDDSDDF